MEISQNSKCIHIYDKLQYKGKTGGKSLPCAKHCPGVSEYTVAHSQPARRSQWCLRCSSIRRVPDWSIPPPSAASVGLRWQHPDFFACLWSLDQLLTSPMRGGDAVYFIWKDGWKDPLPCAVLISPLLTRQLNLQLPFWIMEWPCSWGSSSKDAAGEREWLMGDLGDCFPSPRLPLQTVVNRSERMCALKSLFYLVSNHSQPN